MTVRLRPSITRVRGPAQAQNLVILAGSGYFSGRYAIASTNEGTPFVAILALCNMSSADTGISFQRFPNGLRGAEKLRPLSLLVG